MSHADVFSQNDDRDDEFLLSRIIFLLTYNTTVDLNELVEEQELASSISRACQPTSRSSVYANVMSEHCWAFRQTC